MILRNHGEWSDQRQCWVAAEVGPYWVDIIPMIYNHRVTLTPKDSPDGYVVGWCYPSILAAVAAVAAWDPAAEPEPVGYAKRVGELVALS
jgi:hypothetical protein